MPGDVLCIRQEYHPFSVGRNMREPVVGIVGEDLRLIAAVSVHTPDLHVAGALGIEIDVLAVRRILGAVVQALGRGQASFFAASDGDAVNIKLAVALPDKRERLPVRRPAMPIRRAGRGEPPWSAAADGQKI